MTDIEKELSIPSNLKGKRLSQRILNDISVLERYRITLRTDQVVAALKEELCKRCDGSGGSRSKLGNRLDEYNECLVCGGSGLE